MDHVKCLPLDGHVCLHKDFAEPNQCEQATLWLPSIMESWNR